MKETVTIAIHTYDKANELKALLESEGVECEFQNIDEANPAVFPGVRVKIKTEDLALALRIIENREIFLSPVAEQPDNSRVVLLPVDFSEHSLHATSTAFNLASCLGAKIVILNAYIEPAPIIKIQISASFSLDPIETSVEEKDEGDVLREEAQKRMSDFTSSIRDKIKSGELPAVTFKTEIVSSLPEEGILHWARENNPVCIVMGTRGANSKERDLVGSVSAEVLDGCRVPVITIPEQSHVINLNEISNILLISNFDQDDILALDAVDRFMPATHLNITMLYITSRKRSEESAKQAGKLLMDYCTTRYPRHTFKIECVEARNASLLFEQHENTASKTDMIVVANKKKHILARLFNPSIAHRLLFHADIALMAIPV